VIILVSNRASVTSAKPFAPVVSVTTLLALTVATVFGFVAYLHGVVRLMRVQYLLEAIAAESREAIEENFLPASAYVDVEPPLRYARCLRPSTIPRQRSRPSTGSATCWPSRAAGPTRPDCGSIPEARSGSSGNCGTSMLCSCSP
jgi:hypothetical protein